MTLTTSHKAFRLGDVEISHLEAIKLRLGFKKNVDALRYALALASGGPVVLPKVDKIRTKEEVLEALGKSPFDICSTHNNSSYNTCWKNHG